MTLTYMTRMQCDAGSATHGAEKKSQVPIAVSPSVAEPRSRGPGK